MCMPWEAWVTAGLIVFMLGALASGRAAADAIVLAVVVALMALRILTPAEALTGFANPGVLTVGCLFVVAAGLKETGAVAMLTSRLLGTPRTALAAQARLVLPVAAASAFINNTPIVAMFLPVLSGLARRTGISPSLLFLPLSYAAILGGVCTLIGTSTNVVVSGLIQSHNARTVALGAPADDAALLPPLGMFTISPVGTPVAIAGLVYIVALGRRLLKPRRPDGGSAGGTGSPAAGSRQYTTAMRVGADSTVAGRSVEGAGLRGLPGLFLARIERSSHSIIAVAPDEVVRVGDVLVFVGVLGSVMDLQQIRGLTPISDDEASAEPAAPEQVPRHELKLVEAVISPGSPLVGRSVRDSEFRTRYGGVVIAAHRHGHQLPGKIGRIVLRAGDTLLIEAAPEFARRYRDSADFHLVSELEGSAVPRHERAYAALGVLAGTIALFSLGSLAIPGFELRALPEFVIAMAAALLMVGLRCCSAAHARSAVDWPVLIVIAASFALGQAMEKTGLAGAIASAIMRAVGWGSALTGGDSPGAANAVVLLSAVYLATWACTALMNNNSAAVLMFPIIVRISQTEGVPFTPLAVCMTVAASCEFTSPIGYQTNLMVMGPGGYRLADYIRFGGPLNVVCGVVAVASATLVWGL